MDMDMDNDNQATMPSDEFLDEEEKVDANLLDDEDDPYKETEEEEPTGDGMYFSVMKDMYPNDDFSGAY